VLFTQRSILVAVAPVEKVAPAEGSAVPVKKPEAPVAKHRQDGEACVHDGDSWRLRPQSGRIVVIVILSAGEKFAQMQEWPYLHLIDQAVHYAVGWCAVQLLLDAGRTSWFQTRRAARWVKARVHMEIGCQVRLGIV
jgi:hypothetical protein